MSTTSSSESGQGLIVVGVDGSEPSKMALRWAARHAQLTGARLHAIQAWRVPKTYGMAPGYAPINIDLEADTREDLEGTLEEVMKDYPNVSVTSAVVEGHPARVLVEAAREADLLVVASRGRGAFTGMLLGSVSQHCVQQAECPVLVVRR